MPDRRLVAVRQGANASRIVIQPAASERAEADREAGKRRMILARVKDERAYHDRMVGELSEATRRLEAFVRDLQERRRVAKIPRSRRFQIVLRHTPRRHCASAIDTSRSTVPACLLSTTAPDC